MTPGNRACMPSPPCLACLLVSPACDTATAPQGPTCLSRSFCVFLVTKASISYHDPCWGAIPRYSANYPQHPASAYNTTRLSTLSQTAHSTAAPWASSNTFQSGTTYSQEVLNGGATSTRQLAEVQDIPCTTVDYASQRYEPTLKTATAENSQPSHTSHNFAYTGTFRQLQFSMGWESCWAESHAFSAAPSTIASLDELMSDWSTWQREVYIASSFHKMSKQADLLNMSLLASPLWPGPQIANSQ